MAETAEDYYSVRMQIHDRLLTHKTIFESFMCLLPNEPNLTLKHEQCARILIEKYSCIINCNEFEGIGELKLWWSYILSISNFPKNAHDALIACDEAIFPNIKKLLKIFVTLPITTSSCERSFSTLRRLKTYLRNTSSEDRLNGLALLNIHRDIEISCDAVLNELAKTSRRLDIRLQ